MTTICLNMIVKNESGVIRRCLASVKPLLDSWVVVDTGSSDGTESLIREALADVPGEMHSRPWVDFAHNRNEALRLARGRADYLLFIDADEVLEGIEAIDKATLDQDRYLVKNRDQQVDFYRTLLVRDHPAWRWEGTLHEELVADEPMRTEVLTGVVRTGAMRDSARSRDPSTYLKDAEVLEQALVRNPSDRRSQFYLAQSYGAACEFSKALHAYEKRADMGGFADEVFLSLYFAACLKQDLKHPFLDVTHSYCKAIANDSTRAEPFYALSRFHFQRGKHLLAYLAAKAGLETPPPNTFMYVQRSVYDYSLLLYFAYSAHSLNRNEEAKEAYHSLLANPCLPEDLQGTVALNLQMLA